MSKKILHFDDEEMLSNLYKGKFEIEGFEYKWLSNPISDVKEEFVNQVLEINPDLIIMDIIMPVMDGFKAIEMLKGDERTKEVPIFILTNLSQQEDKDKGISLGADNYLISSQHSPDNVVKQIKDFLNNPNILTIPIKDLHVDEGRYKKANENYEQFLTSTANLHFFKCQSTECLLEFMILSWKADWPDRFLPYCPECGEQKARLIRSVSTDKKVYEVVNSNNF